MYIQLHMFGCISLFLIHLILDISCSCNWGIKSFINWGIYSDADADESSFQEFPPLIERSRETFSRTFIYLCYLLVQFCSIKFNLRTKRIKNFMKIGGDDFYDE